MIANTRPEQELLAAGTPAWLSRQPAAAYYQQLLGRLSFLDAGMGPPRTVGITCSRQGEGVTTIATNLAKTAALQATDRQVLLVDAHLGRPSLHRGFKTDLSPGLSDVLLGRHELKEAIRPSPYQELSLLPAGEVASSLAFSPDPSGLTEAVGQLRTQFELVVFDLPPVNQPGLTLPLAGLMDGMVLVVEAERTDCQVALRSKEVLCQAQAQLLGVVINKGRPYTARGA